MVQFSGTEVIEAIRPIEVCHREDERVFTAVCTDTRAVSSGCLFLALKGERFDGHAFVQEAVQKGAAGVVVMTKEAVPEGVPGFVVADTKTALEGLARFHRCRFSIPVVAITGSNGKTTTKDMVASVLGQRFSVLKTEKNFNNEIGLSKTLLGLEEGHEACVVEMGMRGFGQIEELVETALPTIGVVTNVGTSHIELLGSQEGIAKAKGELIAGLDENGVAVLNGDDERVRHMEALCNGSAVFYGIYGKGLTYWAEDIVYDGRETKFLFCYEDKRMPMVIPATGEHQVYDALAALAVGVQLGLEQEELYEGMRSFQASPMRQEVTVVDEVIFVNDAYNANPRSMEESIKAVRQMAKGRMFAVLGDMLELGDTAVEAHRQIGAFCHQMGVDGLITVGSLAKEMVPYMKERMGVSTSGHEEAVEVLRSLVKKGDTVLLKGSRSMKMETILALFERK